MSATLQTHKTDFRLAVLQAIQRLDPRYQARNPVMFLVWVGSIITTLILGVMLVVPGTVIGGGQPVWFVGLIAFWLWFTVLFANFAESLAEGRGKAQADSLKMARRDVEARKLDKLGKLTTVAASTLRKGDTVRVEAGDIVPADGQVIEGIASVDESAITGESAPVIRESGGDRDAVTGGTRVLSDWVLVRVTADPGESFLDKMIGLVESAKRQKTPNEIALSILLAALTLVFLMACATLLPFSLFSVEKAGSGTVISIAVLIALLVCLIPTTIGGLLSAIGISGMQRLIRANVIATSGRAVEAAGDVNVLLLDKTGTITFGNRQAVEFLPAPNVSLQQLAEAAELSSLADETPEGRSIVALARGQYGLPERSAADLKAEFIPFSAEQRVSGIIINERHILKGAGDAIAGLINLKGGLVPAEITTVVEDIAKKGGTPLMVAEGPKVLGVVYLKDIVKPDIKVRLAELRKMGIKSVMITGDNPLTAAAIASEAGVDDFVAEATPETKLRYIRKMQEGGEMVAMVGDGTNDAPALAQSDVAVAMNSGTQAAKEAGNMVDLDSDPTKLIEIVEIGKQLLMTRGALTTFSISNDLAKYFAIIPAAFATTYPALGVLNVMGLSSPQSAILSAVIFNALIIIALIPLALKGVKYRAESASHMLTRHALIYGLGGIVAPFIGIKLIDMGLSVVGLV
ncbi:potassium-transporting ATPase subunit KdpB [Asticcacaulis excentricus]|uniref:Potassium-transporting ATPase ATP-binding subunit n=1 Tax=Asticcacaulis excentricus (strain ATCC 15261 / DSM 4724 / KCTC 12464 / NCIMB 9791 / VKM B-1370 / CB 48) TaxID=573065 RepID=E8RRM3_ASTEC|nr:potassium-transporting ATPase subunit KdpB [Asticcacaulis excentricus]ADU12344.1 K+-transporting ATPase, B subunit [Asticcacaulis excentricus CB 48]